LSLSLTPGGVGGISFIQTRHYYCWLTASKSDLGTTDLVAF